MFGSTLYGPEFSTEEMSRVFSDEARVRTWLEVEATFAEVQAELGVIPGHAARAIRECATLDSVPVSEVTERFRETGLDSVALVGALADAAGAAGEYVHFGFTMVDLTETAMALRLSEAVSVLRGHLLSLESELLSLAEAHRRTPMVARTHSQHALPYTFGLKAALWALEVRKCLRALSRAGDGVRVGRARGGVGTYAAFGGAGREMEERIMDRLGLEPADPTIQVSPSRIRDYVSVLGRIGATCGWIANEVWIRGRTEIGELRAPTPGATSSAFPGKRNPLRCEWIRGLGALSKHAANAVRDLHMEDERDGTRFVYYRGLVPAASMVTDAAVVRLSDVVSGLEVDADRMAENLRSTGTAATERVTMALARAGAGKRGAYGIVADCVSLSREEGIPLAEALRRDGRALEHVDEGDLDRLTDPAGYLGEAPDLVDEVVSGIRAERPG